MPLTAAALRAEITAWRRDLHAYPELKFDVHRTAGIVAEPVLTAPGRDGVARAASGAALLVVGLSERWREDGLGQTRAEFAEEPPA